jgi:hypothetical protein
MRGSIGVAMQAFCEKFYQYGGLIWLLGRCGIPLPIGTCATALLLLVTSYAECWLPGRTAEITDAVMVLVIGGGFALLRGAARSGAAPEHAAPSKAAVEHAKFAESVLGQHGVRPAAAAQRRGKHAPYVPPHLRG